MQSPNSWSDNGPQSRASDIRTACHGVPRACVGAHPQASRGAGPSLHFLRLPLRNLALIAGIVGALGALGACGKKDEMGAASAKSPEASKPGAAAPAPAAAPKGLPVKAEPVKIAQVDSEVSAVGSLIAAESVVIRPEIPGRVVGLHFQEGQVVGKGAKLVTLDASEYQAQLAGTSADARTESQRYQRTKELMDKNFVSQDALDVAKGNMERANAKKEQDQALLSKTAIIAPFSGVLGLRQISPGAYVKAGDDIVRLENISALKLDFRLPEVYLSQVKVSQPLQIKVDAYPNDTFPGKIYAFEPAVDEKTRTVVVRAQIPNPQGKLRPGMFARVNVLLETTSERGRDPGTGDLAARPRRVRVQGRRRQSPAH